MYQNLPETSSVIFQEQTWTLHSEDTSLAFVKMTVVPIWFCQTPTNTFVQTVRRVCLTFEVASAAKVHILMYKMEC